MLNQTKKFHGIIPPVITPLNADGSIDKAGLEKLIDRLCKGGVHGLFILGTTGEGPALGLRVQKEMIHETIRINAQRLPVLVGISNAALEDTLAIAEVARQAGADALVCAPPCYFMPGGEEIYDYFKQVASNVRLPLFIYNMPAMTKINLTPAMVKRLAELPNVAGYKDSSGSMCDLHEVIQALKERPDFSIFVGPEELLGEAVFFGADGGVSGGANLHPELFVAMYHAAKAGNIPEVRRLQEQIYRQRKLYSLGHYQSSIIKGIKSALSQQGICNDTMAEPFQSFKTAERQQVGDILKKL